MPTTRLQALVCDILPSTTAVFSYAIGPRKLSANEQVFFLNNFYWCSNISKFVTNNSNYIRRLFYVAMLLTPAQIKPKSFESRRNFFFFKSGVDESHVYVTCVLGRYVASTVLSVPKLQGAEKRYSVCDQYPNLSEGPDRVGGQLHGDKEWP